MVTFFQAIGVMPDLSTVKSIQKIAWSASSGSLHLVHSSHDDIHDAHKRMSAGMYSSQNITNYLFRPV